MSRSTGSAGNSVLRGSSPRVTTKFRELGLRVLRRSESRASSASSTRSALLTITV
eukprot:CAMPEP_0204556482 /NCGR_PEP_ID=MMETSP0661-20131031/29622_1 /ASSEMBLY_ACC=CAM_ASM_000606 /TAXON_ID=109239 /ORGANISM="Alexandrium margalefi, Strain AMGDE01CS-322" /LENGTH=54 /DNA_ID=CAMNT_0051563591 /DNA_START=19 /DNA_END=180 /DNA_ORIENTATION=+